MEGPSGPSASAHHVAAFQDVRDGLERLERAFDDLDTPEHERNARLQVSGLA